MTDLNEKQEIFGKSLIFSRDLVSKTVVFSNFFFVKFHSGIPVKGTETV